MARRAGRHRNLAAFPKEIASDIRVLGKGGAIQLAGQLLARGLSFVFVAFAARMLGPAGYGIYRQVKQVLLTLGEVAPGGFNFAVVREIARGRALGDHGAVRGAVRFSLRGAVIVSLLLFAGVLIGADWIASILADSGQAREQMTAALRVGAIFVPLYALMQVLRFATQGYKTMWPSVAVGSIIQPGLAVILSLGALLAGLGITGVIVAEVMATGVAVLVAAHYYLRIRTEKERLAPPTWNAGQMTRFALALGGTRLFNTQSLGLGVLLLGVVGTDREVGLFAIALSLQTIGVTFFQSMTNIWAPVVADVYERGDLVRLESLYQTLNRWVATFSLPLLMALIVRPDVFVRILGGPRADEAAILCAILAAGNLFFVTTGPTGYVLAMTGRTGINFLNSFAAVVVYILLGALLVPRYGAIGMAAVDAVVTAMVNSARVIEAKLLVGVQPFGRSFMKPVIATLLGAVVLLGVRVAFGPDLVAGLLSLPIAGVVYVAALWLMGVAQEERYVLGLIRARLRR